MSLVESSENTRTFIRVGVREFMETTVRTAPETVDRIWDALYWNQSLLYDAKRLWLLMHSLIRQPHRLTSCFVGYPSGELVGFLGRVNSVSFFNFTSKTQGLFALSTLHFFFTAYLFHFFLLDTTTGDYNPENRYIPSLPYNATHQQWYKDAASKRRLIWSDVTPNIFLPPTLFIPVARPIYPRSITIYNSYNILDSTTPELAVVGCSLALSNFSSFLREQRRGNDRLFVVDRNGYIIGCTYHTQMLTFLL